MRRRDFIKVIASSVAAWPFAAHAQQAERVRRIGMLTSLAADDPQMSARDAAFWQALQELGWTVGRNLRVEQRWGAGDPERMRKHAAELAALAPDVILVTGGATEWLLKATRTIPVVFVAIADPVAAGFVESLARPGGNATGFTTQEYSLSVKHLELLKEIAPDVTRIGVLRDANSIAGIGQFGAVQAAASSLKVELTPPRQGRDRARHRGIRAQAEQRLDRDGDRVDGGSPRFDHHACGASQAACGLPILLLRRRRRPDFLWLGIPSINTAARPAM